MPNHFYVELNFPEFFVAKLGATKVLWEAGELTMAEIQQVGILVSKANGCAYCTAAFCTILNHGLGTSEDYVAELVRTGAEAADSARLRTLLDYALKVNGDAAGITDEDVDGLRAVGLTDRGIVQITHIVSDFASYNRLEPGAADRTMTTAISGNSWPSLSHEQENRRAPGLLHRQGPHLPRLPAARVRMRVQRPVPTARGRRRDHSAAPGNQRRRGGRGDPGRRPAPVRRRPGEAG